MKGLLKTKTFWASLAGIFGSIGALVLGEVTVPQGLLAICGFLVAMFIRDAVAKA
jgi:hypothetical protein